MLQAFLFGLLGGAIRVLLGFHDATVKDPKGVSFQWNKAVVSTLLGGLVGLAARPVMLFLGTPAEFVNSEAALGLIVVLGAAGVYSIEDLFPMLTKRFREVLPFGK